METEHLINYPYKTIQEFYEQGIISSAQWEAYDFIASHTFVSVSFPYFWGSLPGDSRVEYWKLYKVLPERIQKIMRRVTF